MTTRSSRSPELLDTALGKDALTLLKASVLRIPTASVRLSMNDGRERPADTVLASTKSSRPSLVSIPANTDAQTS